ncbi:MAG: hypothetical protein MUE75_04820 [Algoriphagus sp.]|jgi:hypothetical protein|nr:hypothetical protein [Algoriphagus sp.]
MENKKEELDLEFWLDKSIIERQNQLKSQFLQLLESVGNSISNEELSYFFTTSRGKKITKGNDLLGYPYQVLDLVRDFDKTSGCNIRLLNWFGHGFFILIFLGKTTNIPSKGLVNLGFQLGQADDPWDFGALILKKKVIRFPTESEILAIDFQLWIKEVPIPGKELSTIKLLVEDVKKILTLKLKHSS